MIKRLLIITIISVITLAMPSFMSAAETSVAGMEQIEEQEISITVEQSTVYITGASGKTLEVVSLTGKPVMKIKIDSPAQRVELNVPKGCYILKIGKVVRKVSVR